VNALSKKLGIATIIFWVTYNIYYFLPGNFKWSVSLPLHVCDIVGLVAGVVMITPSRQLRAILYFFAIALTTQALITPTGNQDPLTARFWFYWGLHIAILCCSFFDLIVRAYRPTVPDFLFSIYFSIAYIFLILPLNIIFDWNYGYIGNSKPDVTTFVDAFGVWPNRVFYMFSFVILMQLIFFLPWIIYKKKPNVH